MIGEDFRSDIALDDLSIEKGNCTGTRLGLGKGSLSNVMRHVVSVLNKSWSRRIDLHVPLSIL